MTVALYVLDVPEFEPVVSVAKDAGMELRRVGDYLELSSARRDVVLSRDGSSIRTSVWYAALTGGLDGRISSFTKDTLHLTEQGR
jgi:hypothetical protein